MTKKINKKRNMKKINIMESQEHLLYEDERKPLIGLWLDDSRHNPTKFLSDKKPSESGKIVQGWYNDNMGDYDIQWTSVSNFDQFKNYIEQNGVPEFVSLDHDLKKDKANIKDIGGQEYLYTGADCALWLVSYCLRGGIPIPKNYIHSANDDKRVYISKAFRMGKMGKDPLEGVDIDNPQKFVEAANAFRNRIMNPNIGNKLNKFKDSRDLGAADRLARMRGLSNTNNLFDKTSYRESKESIIDNIIKETIHKTLKM